ncbi:MAG TPA: S26 family signal peptidase [Candidatus Saccharimonadales bacterium]|nr:S26 family signal peptidase [Candidatus Saccharimonadales bacterium]
MAPAYTPGRLVFAARLRKPRVGDVVIVRHHHLELIKRISQIEDGRVYLLGDNPMESTDSRHYGWLPLASVQGIVWGGYQPANPIPVAEAEPET